MTFENPHIIFPQLPIPRLHQLLPGAMPTLVSPSVNASLAAEIPELLKAVQPFLGSDDLDRQTIHSSLLLLADDLDHAHTICQNIPTSRGSACHAIMHRREGDFSNSKYWWRRAAGITWQSPTPLHQQLITLLADAPAELAPWRDTLSRTNRYDPAQFVDLVDRLHDSASPQSISLLVQAQRLEWASLFLECLAPSNH